MSPFYPPGMISSSRYGAYHASAPLAPQYQAVAGPFFRPSGQVADANAPPATDVNNVLIDSTAQTQTPTPTPTPTAIAPAPSPAPTASGGKMVMVGLALIAVYSLASYAGGYYGAQRAIRRSQRRVAGPATRRRAAAY